MCGAKGGSLSPAALAKLAKIGKSAIEWMNERPRELQFRRPEDQYLRTPNEQHQGPVVRVIPAKADRTAKATVASMAKRRAPVERVMELTAAGKTAGQIGITLRITARHVRRLLARGRVEAATSGEKPRT